MNTPQEAKIKFDYFNEELDEVIAEFSELDRAIAERVQDAISGVPSANLRHFVRETIHAAKVELDEIEDGLIDLLDKIDLDVRNGVER